MGGRITVRREASERGLARICQSPRGYEVRFGGKIVGIVQANRVCFGQYKDWFWYTRTNELGVAHQNACNSPVATAEEARDQCVAYVRECLEKSGAIRPRKHGR